MAPYVRHYEDDHMTEDTIFSIPIIESDSVPDDEIWVIGPPPEPEATLQVVRLHGLATDDE